MAGAIWALVGVFIGAVLVWVIMIVTEWPGGRRN